MSLYYAVLGFALTCPPTSVGSVTLEAFTRALVQVTGFYLGMLTYLVNKYY